MALTALNAPCCGVLCRSGYYDREDDHDAFGIAGRRCHWHDSPIRLYLHCRGPASASLGEGRFSQCNSNGGCSRLLLVLPGPLTVPLPLARGEPLRLPLSAAATQWHPGRHGGLRVGLESDHCGTRPRATGGAHRDAFTHTALCHSSFDVAARTKSCVGSRSNWLFGPQDRADEPRPVTPWVRCCRIISQQPRNKGVALECLAVKRLRNCEFRGCWTEIFFQFEVPWRSDGVVCSSEAQAKKRQRIIQKEGNGRPFRWDAGVAASLSSVRI